MKRETPGLECIRGIKNAFVLYILLACLCYWLSACSFAVEFGYHGETGRDNRTQTQLTKK